MIRKPNNWDSVQASALGYKREQLPPGGYEAKIVGTAVLVNNSNGAESLAIQVDITVGEFAGFFKRDYNNNPYENKKWRGVARFRCPNDDPDDKGNSIFKGMIEAIEKSNSGYTWNWEEKSLKGLKVGILVRDKEYDFNGNHGFSSEIFAFTDIKIIRDGNFETPKPKLLNNGSTPLQVAPPNSYGDPPPLPSDDDYPDDFLN